MIQVLETTYNIEICYSQSAVEVFQAHPGEWVDLAVPEDVFMNAGDFQYISFGLSMKIPDGFEAIMAPRSSTFKNYGILQTNSIGVIDNSYCGPNDIWKMPAYATRDTVIPAGSRIAQFRIQPIQDRLNFIRVTENTNADRGGLGSTGA